MTPLSGKHSYVDEDDKADDKYEKISEQHLEDENEEIKKDVMLLEPLKIKEKKGTRKRPSFKISQNPSQTKSIDSSQPKEEDNPTGKRGSSILFESVVDRLNGSIHRPVIGD